MVHSRLYRPLLVLVLVLVWYGALVQPVAAARRPSHVGTITAISSTALTIHSKTHKTYYHFVITSDTAFLQHGKPVARSLFKIGSYVTVTYATGPNGTLIAIHVSLRQVRKV
jgi:hypothetical protein